MRAEFPRRRLDTRQALLSAAQGGGLGLELLGPEAKLPASDLGTCLRHHLAALAGDPLEELRVHIATTPQPEHRTPPYKARFHRECGN